MKKFKYTLLLATMLFTAGITFGQEDSGRKLDTTLSGAVEVPGPGDTDGGGTASFRFNQGKNQICYDITVTNIAVATGAHIHDGAVGVAGPVLVTLMVPAADGKSSGCVEATADLIKRIRQNPENFYVNIHNAEFPDGAVRGQLGKKP